MNPYFEGLDPSECIDDDRIILFTDRNWFFGLDDTGNLMSWSFLQELSTEVTTTQGGALLITADGSMDCQENPAEQELMTHPLHLCEVICSLFCLRPGGSLVLKMFTFFEVQSVSLLYLLSCCFEEVHVYKPITSKLGNSEVYVIACNFLKPRNLPSILEELKPFYGCNNKSLHSIFNRETIPLSFIDRVISCSEFFKTRQIIAIERNIRLFNNTSCSQLGQSSELLKILVMNEFLQRNRCSRIKRPRIWINYKLWNLVEKGRQIPGAKLFKLSNRIWNETRINRLKYINSYFNPILEFFSAENTETNSVFHSECFTLDRLEQSSLTDALNISKGKQFLVVKVSKLIYSKLLSILLYYIKENASPNELREILSTPRRRRLECENNDSCVKFKENSQRIMMEEINRREVEAVKVMDEGYYMIPYNSVSSLNQFLDLIKEGKVIEGDSVAFINCPLLTRTQFGLFIILCSLFKKITFFEPTKDFSASPFFLLSSFRSSTEEAKKLMESLMDKGYNVKEISSGSSSPPCQLFPIQYLIRSPLYIAVCRYNSYMCINRINCLRTIIL